MLDFLFGGFKTVAKKSLRNLNFFVYRQEMFVKESQEIQVQNLFLSKESGVLHLGGHKGQEIRKYADLGLKVIWIEANPEIFAQLERNLEGFPTQKAYCALLSSKDGEELDFHVSSGDAGSSSIYEFGSQLGYSDLSMISSIKLISSRLDSVLATENLSNFGHWVVDVQGAELEVLMGAESSLRFCSSMFIEVSTREVYKGGTTYDALKRYLSSHDLYPLWDPQLESHENVIFVRPRR